MLEPSLLPRAGCLLVVATALAACAWDARETKRYPFTLLAESDPHEPLGAVRLLQNGKQVAETGAEGYGQFTLVGDEGQRVALTTACPIGTTADERELTLTLRTYANPQYPEVLVRCNPTDHELAVVAMFENGAHLPIQHRLKTLAVTDRDGIAHFTLRGRPGETFELAIATDEQPGLRPMNPVTALTIRGRDEADVVERTFMVPKQPTQPHARGPRRPKRIR